ncbi:MAG TPA: YfcZ/YiiS family protein [Arsenophonus sp.]
MSDAKNRCHAEETTACCCVDVGTVIDNQNRTACFEESFSSKQEAKTMLTRLIEKARAVESSPCTIEY